MLLHMHSTKLYLCRIYRLYSIIQYSWRTLGHMIFFSSSFPFLSPLRSMTKRVYSLKIFPSASVPPRK